jgi:hypothetical protein
LFVATCTRNQYVRVENDGRTGVFHVESPCFRLK